MRPRAEVPVALVAGLRVEAAKQEHEELFPAMEVLHQGGAARLLTALRTLLRHPTAEPRLVP